MSHQRLKGWIGICLLLISGAFIGASITLYYYHWKLESMVAGTQNSSKDWFLSSISEQLDLSETQQSSIRTLYDKTLLRRSLAVVRSRPIQNKPRYKFVSEMNSYLSDNQKMKFQKLLEERIRKARYSKVADTLIELDLPPEKIKQFDEILAKHATEDLEDLQSLDKAFAELFRRALPDLQMRLSEKKSQQLEQLIQKNFNVQKPLDITSR